jgi:archaellum component FlaC
MGADEAGTASILSNFGVALASTIAGIFLRVILHQIRVDPADVESMTRIELAEAAKRVKGTLDSVTVDMSRFHDEVRQRTDDVVADVLQKVQSMLGDFSTAVGTASSEVIAQIGQTQNDVAEKSTIIIGRMEETANHAAAAIESLRRVEAPPTKLANRLEKVTASLEALGGQVQVLSEQIGGMGASTQGALDKLVESLERLRQLTEDDRRQYGEGLREIGSAVRELKTELGGVGEVLIADASLIRSLEEQARRSAAAVENSQRAANDVLTALTESTRALVTVVRRETSSGPG